MSKGSIWMQKSRQAMAIIRQKEHLRLHISTYTFNAEQIIECKEAGKKMLSASSNCFLSALNHFEPSLK